MRYNIHMLFHLPIGLKVPSHRGFTLIETLIAITVLLLSVVGPLQIAAQALFSAFYSRDEITAYYLAAEAIEYVKNSRDTTFLNDVFRNLGVAIDDDHWLYGLTPCISDTGCIVDATQPFMKDDILNVLAVALCPNEGCAPISYCADTSGDNTSLGAGIFAYNFGYETGVSCGGSAAASKFTRNIKIIPQTNDGNLNEEARIEVKIAWKTRALVGGEKQISVTSFMTNWQRK